MSGRHHTPGFQHHSEHGLYERRGIAAYLCNACGKEYSTSHHLSHHQQNCTSTKRGLSLLLDETRSFWKSRKRRKLGECASQDQPRQCDRPRGASPVDTTQGSGVEAASSTQQTRISGPTAVVIVTPGGLPSVQHDSAGADRTGVPEARGVAGPSSTRQLEASSISTLNEPSAEGTDQPPDDLHLSVAQRKPKRQTRLPARYRQEDTLPEALPAPVIRKRRGTSVVNSGGRQSNVGDRSANTPAPLTSPPLRPLVIHASDRNKFGLLRKYTIPDGLSITHDPDGAVTLKNLTDSSVRAVRTAKKKPPQESYGPFPNKSTFSLADWYWNSSHKSFIDFQKLIEVLKEPDFALPDVVDLDWKAAFHALGANREDLPDDQGRWIQDDGWKHTRVSLDIPFHHRTRNPGEEKYDAGEFHHRSLVSVIKEKILNAEDSRSFHYYPYQSTWKATDTSPEVDVYGELYGSKAFRDAHEEVQRQPSSTINEGMERVVVALMFWSDATHLTSFGTASLWPCYLFFGNDSKYRRCHPSERLGEQVAYFIKLPPGFNDYLKQRNRGKLPTDALTAYCSRQLLQAQWNIMLDEELRDAMKNGIILLCPDGRKRVLLSGIQNNGGCPCHRCLIEKPNLSNLGAPTDSERRDSQRCPREQALKVEEARATIRKGYAVDSKKLDVYLKDMSLVPLHNPFVCLSELNFDISAALVVDLLHEFEIGVWKRLFMHLIRLLDAFTNAEHLNGDTLTAALDARYRATPAFGPGTIRKFGTNASAMKRKAARDYEDLLQCAIPAFDMLLPEPHHSILMRLLCICGQWHALAKLRLHHDLTVQLLEYTTVQLGAQMRRFNYDTCLKVATKESQREADARARRESNGNAKGSASRKPVNFSIFTIKFHFLGDYAMFIRKFGTCDSYSTETGELFHRLPKSWFDRTDKRNFEGQFTKIERRRARLDKIRAESVEEGDTWEALEGREDFSPDSRYALGSSRKRVVHLQHHARSPDLGEGDPYAVDFFSKLKQHLLPRILSRLGFNLDTVLLDPEAWTDVVLGVNDRVYSHKIMRMNYTTYDVRRDEDVIHVDTPQCNVMLIDSEYNYLCPDNRNRAHPYLYAKIIGLFHADVQFIGDLPDGTRSLASHRIDFAYAHWYQHLGPVGEFSLDRLALSPLHCDTALTFVDPEDIIRAVHIIPQFSLGKEEIGIGRSALLGTGPQDVWRSYYLNRFADRDLFMRYQYGMSIGHTYMHADAFPPAKVPIIPPDFDHCLDPLPHGDCPAESAPAADDSNVEGDHAEVGSSFDADENHMDDMDDEEVAAMNVMYGDTWE